MNILQSIKSALFPRIIQSSLPPSTLEWYKRYGKPLAVDVNSLVKRYWGWAYMCAQLSASRFASIPLKLYVSRSKGQSYVKNFATKKVDKDQSQWIRRRIGKSLPQVAGAEDFEELEEHPLLDLLQNINDQENSFELRELTCTMLDLTGNAYWYIEKDNVNLPTKIFLLRSQWVRIVPDATQFISEFIYGENIYNNPVHLKPEEVIHFKYPNPSDPWYGMGPVQSAAYAIESQELREKFILATMNNMARPDLIVKYLDGELAPNDRAILEREWNAMFKGAKNAGKVKVTDFRYEIDKVGWTPAELRFNEGEDWIMKKICGAFPVPIGLVDTSQISRAPRAGMEGADLFMSQFNTLPRCTRIEEKLNEKLCPMYDERLFLAFDNPVPKDKLFQLNEDTTRLNTYQTTINEIRQRDGAEPVEWGNVPLMPQNIVPLGSQPLSPEPETDAGNIQPKNNADTTSEAIGLSREGVSPSGTQFKNVLKQASLQGMELEIDGGYVSQQLIGIPLRIKPARNELGRFHKIRPGQLRVTGDEADGLKRNLRLKFVKKVGNEYCVFSHQTGKNFGCYPTKEEAEERLKQMHRFKSTDELVNA